MRKDYIIWIVNNYKTIIFQLIIPVNYLSFYKIKDDEYEEESSRLNWACHAFVYDSL